MCDRVVVLSRGIIRISNLNSFLGSKSILPIFRWLYSSNAVVGWGFKSTAKRARHYAKKHGLPYVALEDGFLRSIGLGVAGAQPLSLVVDDVGIYYDARQPSKLEILIEKSDGLGADELVRSRLCIDAIRQYRLSKYNQNQRDGNLLKEKPKVLVIDQTMGDASVEGAQASKETFVEMLKRAVEENPEETIWVKVHPDVAHGKKKGFLYPLPFEHPNIRLHTEKVNPWDFLDSVKSVYTVSSLMGFEALIAGASVHCFGVPFYAGWGMTNDRQQCPRRNVNRSLEQLFYAAYIQYARYVDPILGERCEIENIISYMADTLKIMAKPSKTVSMSKLSWWKQRWIGDYLKAWRFEKLSSEEGEKLRWGRGALDDNSYCIEDGFIRSVGLGVHFNRPVSLVCDSRGIYFDARESSDLEYLLENLDYTNWDCTRARALISQLLAANLTKYNVGSECDFSLPQDRKVILVPGQVESDASIKYGSPEIYQNETLLKAVKAAEPDAYIIYKPHPDVLAGQRDNGNWQGDFTHTADHVETQASMASLLDVVDEVHTMTSLTGFEALLRGKLVTCYGLPFYAGWGLTNDKLTCTRRTRSHSVESLVYFALIEYPTYVDPVTRQAMTAEQAVARVAQMKAGKVQVKDTKLQWLLAMKKAKNTLKRFIRT
ncbi:capsular polysaccharide biosynthesis protein [Vibrio campbellii]|uniref:capsular polysaccharide biosynthesis protein n=1 Tax=Vibrio campbellii TaxID=680 RepID=UPI00142D4728|nr:capsular polysaccharide biosynthesis protein [Vibrio campbellii]NIY87088.1 capsular polysaccharide biosynthesis protein [Vibrio campbellii]NVK67530.1 capsular polysaccharide biosynthesis protein [Vibrio campbellii]